MAETFEQWFKQAASDTSEGATLKAAYHSHDTEIAALRNHLANASKEIERLKRPEMTSELPTREGWYWHKHWDCLQVVRVFLDRGIWRYLAPASGCSHRIWPDVDEFWSAKPIEPDPMPEGGE